MAFGGTHFSTQLRKSALQLLVRDARRRRLQPVEQRLVMLRPLSVIHSLELLELLRRPEMANEKLARIKVPGKYDNDVLYCSIQYEQ